MFDISRLVARSTGIKPLDKSIFSGYAIECGISRTNLYHVTLIGLRTGDLQRGIVLLVGI